ncbi:hypothetical protein KCP75_12470 [Salmonella enterica subsp. enterica]|nr:hypothetical protein KCP75_12470 [Salmonella enterica subsp. enterica]
MSRRREALGFILQARSLAGWRYLCPLLLKPFTASKAVGLGIGLSMLRIMAQNEERLRLASTLTRNACAVNSPVTDVDDVE